MTTSKQVLKDGSIELTLNIPWPEVKKTYDIVIDELVKSAEIDGFRKGKAPRSVVEKKLDTTKTYEEVLKQLIPDAYSRAVKEQELHPVIMPKIELLEAQEGKDWKIRALTAERPSVTLGAYKEKIKELRISTHKKIWLPGQEQKDEKGKDESKKPTLDELLRVVFENVTVSIPDLLIEQEVNRSLSELIDQTKKLGLSVEQYLSSTHKTAESVRTEYAKQAERTLTLELALEAIADKEGIILSDDDIDKTINAAKTEEEKNALKKERYYLATILRRQKTLDFLASLY